MPSPPLRSKLSAAVAASLLLAAGTFVGDAGAAEPPSVRLLVADRTVTVHVEGDGVPLDIGAYAAAVRGDFELRVSRADYDSPLQISQVDSETGDVVRPLPADVLKGWGGLKRFFHVRFKNEAGRVVAERDVAFCPNSWERQRVDDRGPEYSRYPTYCRTGFPFLKGMVWGIDAHWAVSAFSSGGYRDRFPTVDVGPGVYHVRVSINDTYRALLDIPARHATEVLTVTVEGHGGSADGEAQAQSLRSEQMSMGVPTVTDPAPSTRPDLVALPAYALRTRTRGARDLLAFASTPWNAGPAPMVVEGFRETDEEVMDAYQYFYDDDGNPVGRAPAGTMEFDDRHGHHHWHFRQFVTYSLLDLSEDKVVRSKKQSFCLFPTDPVDLTAPRAEWSPDYETGSMCGSPRSIWIREKLPAGWGDTYYQYVAGQAFNITKVPNGWYYVRVTVNPQGRLYETTEANNEELRLVRLSGQPGARRVLAAPWHGMDV
jgi:hypothetical protein